MGNIRTWLVWHGKNKGCTGKSWIEDSGLEDSEGSRLLMKRVSCRNPNSVAPCVAISMTTAKFTVDWTNRWTASHSLKIFKTMRRMMSKKPPNECKVNTVKIRRRAESDPSILESAAAGVVAVRVDWINNWFAVCGTIRNQNT